MSRITDRLAVLASLIIILAALAASPPETTAQNCSDSEGPSEAHGYVLTAQTGGSPIPGATVDIERKTASNPDVWALEATVTTNSNGLWSYYTATGNCGDHRARNLQVPEPYAPCTSSAKQRTWMWSDLGYPVSWYTTAVNFYCS
jgi:hypothetical protein